MGGDANLMPTHGRCSRAGMIFGHHLLLDYCLKVRNFDPEEKELLQIRISWGLDWMDPIMGPVTNIFISSSVIATEPYWTLHSFQDNWLSVKFVAMISIPSA